MLAWLRNKLFKRQPAKEEWDFGVVPDPGLANHNFFRQWVGIFQLVDKMARARGGNQAERPLDERMLYIARGLMRYNGYAQGFISALRTHTLGSNGLVHHFVGPSAKKCQVWLDRWKDEVDWWSREREIYERIHIEGEALPRIIADADGVDLRMIEPEWLVPKDGSVEWTYGVYNEPGDVENQTAVNVLYGDVHEEVDGSEYIHIKCKLAVRADKRGRSDFLPSAQLLDDSFKVWRNFLQAEAVRQGIVYFSKQAEGVTKEDIAQAIASQEDYAPPAAAGDRRNPPGISLDYGAGIEHLTNGTEVEAVPTAQAQNAISGVNASLLAVGRQYQMPLVLISGDMSANNTLDFGDESPFGTAIADEQRWYSRHVRNVLWRVMEWAASEGHIDSDFLHDGTNLEVSSERKPARDAEKNTSRAKTLYDDGVISGRERSTMEGVDYDEQQAQRQREGLRKLGEPAPQETFEDVGLVEKEVIVHRNGRTFRRKQKVRAQPIAKEVTGKRKEREDALLDAIKDAHSLSDDNVANVEKLLKTGGRSSIVRIVRAVNAHYGSKVVLTGKTTDEVADAVMEVVRSKRGTRTEKTTATTKIANLHDVRAIKTQLVKDLGGYNRNEHVEAVVNVLKQSSEDGGEVREHGMSYAEKTRKVKVGDTTFHYPDTPEGHAAAAGTLVEMAKKDWPPKVLEANSRIIITTQKSKDDDYWAEKYNMPGFTTGATGGDGQIVTYRGARMSAGTFAHEAGHNIAKRLWDTPFPPADSPYGRAQKEEKPVSEYGAKSSGEDFAEAVRLFTGETKDHEFLKSQFPKKFAVIKELLG